MKAYITKSFATVKQEVEEWLSFFESRGIRLRIKKIQVLPVYYPNDKAPSTNETGFQPILVGEVADTKHQKRFSFSYDEYFRIEEIITTGKYRWKESEADCVYTERDVQELDSAMTVAMLTEWAEHMRIDNIEVEWELKK